MLQQIVTFGDYWVSLRNWNADYPSHYNFIQDINNEKGDHPEYKERLSSVKYFGMYYFGSD